MAMAQRLEVYRGAGDGAKASGEKKGSGRFPKKQNKKGAALDSAGKRSGRSCPSHPKSAKEGQGQGQGAPTVAAEKEKAVLRKMFQLWRRPPPQGLQGVEGDASEIPLFGKLAAWPPLPIQTGDQDDDFCFIAEMTMEGDGAGESH